MDNSIAITTIVCVSFVVAVAIIKGSSFIIIGDFKDLKGKIFVTGNKKNSIAKWYHD